MTVTHRKGLVCWSSHLWQKLLLRIPMSGWICRSVRTKTAWIWGSFSIFGWLPLADEDETKVDSLNRVLGREDLVGR